MALISLFNDVFTVTFRVHQGQRVVCSKIIKWKRDEIVSAITAFFFEHLHLFSFSHENKYDCICWIIKEDMVKLTCFSLTVYLSLDWEELWVVAT